MATENVLQRIMDHKRVEIAAARSACPQRELEAQVADAPPVRDFLQSLRNHHPMGLIAEVKKASPSAGLIRADFDPVQIATAYAANGAACVSVLTDEHFFMGHLHFLRDIRSTIEIPVLRKDFILDPYQVWEARVFGADCVLLIAECLADDELRTLFELAGQLGMRSLIEIYDPQNLQRVLDLQPGFIGVNNRDLRTFATDLNHTVRLREQIPAGVLVIGESGIHSRSDVKNLQAAGVHGILVGESLMRQADIGAAVAVLLADN